MKRSIVPFVVAVLVFSLTILFLDKTGETSIQFQSFTTQLFSYLMALVFALASFLTLYFKKVTSKQVVSNLYIVLFFAIILTPEFVKQFGLEKTAAIDEKRPLAPRPVFSFTKDYPARYEAYYNDNFGLRSNIISFTNKMKTSLFRASTKPDVVQFGEDGFLFLVSGYAIEPSYTNENLLSASELEEVYQRIAARRDRLAAKGIQFIVGYWPNKHTTYRDALPKSMKAKIKNKTSLGDQIGAYFKARNLNFLDVKEDLWRATKQDQLYQKFDTHWNLDGAFEGYRSLLRQMKSQLKLTAFNKEDFEITFQQTRKGDLVYMLGMGEFPDYYDELPHYNLKDSSLHYQEVDASNYPERTIITVNKNCPNKQTALVFRDSYGKDFIPFLSLHYQKVIYIYCSDKPYYDNEIIEKVQPDVVMSLGVERYLSWILK